MSGQTRRWFLWAGAGAGVGLAAGAGVSAIAGSSRHAGCGPRSANLAVLIGEDLTPGSIRREVIRNWHLDVTLVELPQRTDLMRVELAALAQTGSCLYDVVDVDVAWTNELAASGFLLPIRSLPLGLLDFAVEAGRVGGTQYTAPFVTDAAILYYRRDLLGDRPLPRTFSEAVVLGNRLKARLEADDAVGYAGQFADYEGLTVNALEAIWSKGGDELTFVGKQGTAGRVALTELIAWIADLSILAETDEQTTVDAFREGRAVFLRNWPFAFHQLKSSPRMKGRVGIAALPWRSVLGGHNLGITIGATGDRARRAEEFIGYLGRAENQDALFELGGNPPVRASSYQPTCASSTAQTGEGPGEMVPSCAQLKHLAAELQLSLRCARQRPRARWYSHYSRVLRSHLYPALSGAADAVDFAALHDEVDAIVSSGS